MTNIEKLQRALPKEADAALITSDVNRHYYSGMASSAGTLLVTRDKAFLVIDFRYIEKAKSTCRDCEVILQDKLYSQIETLCRDNKIKALAVEAERMSLSALAEWKRKLSGIIFLEDGGLDKAILSHRSVKSEAEIMLIRAAQRITDKTFSEVLNFIERGRTEREVAAYLEYCMRKNGADGTAFDTISVSGKNSSMPHGVPSDKKLAAGDFLTLDFGAKKDGYCSDMTRTVAIGAVSDKQYQVYHTVLKAQQTALNAVCEGALCSEVDRVGRAVIEDEAGFKGCFGHSMGHSLGLEIHEQPGFSPSCDKTAQAGNVLSVEPGIYLEGRFGVRIEDIVAVTKNGCENLTHSPKELIIL